MEIVLILCVILMGIAVLSVIDGILEWMLGDKDNGQEQE